MSDQKTICHGDEEGFHVTVRERPTEEGYEITIWNRNYGTCTHGIRDRAKAERFAAFVYETLLPEWEAEQIRMRESMERHMAELAARPKPKPLKVQKNSPKLKVLVCPDCEALVLPEDVSDERVYECQSCGTTGTGEEGRRCESCNKFASKISDTSCPECSAPMDEAESAEAQRATNGTLVRCGE